MIEQGNTVSQVIDNLRRTIQALNESYKSIEQDTGLTSPQLWAVKLVASAAPLKVSELAKGMFLHPATVVGIIDRLEAKGLVVRTRSTEDRRVVELDLTPAGRELVAKAPEAAQVMLVRGLETLPKKSLQQVAAGMEQLVRILGAEDRVPQLLFSQDMNMPVRQKSLGRPTGSTVEE
ncbi:MAG: MarR family transcriptional regulator [Steroidobacteraceae bacterium]|nr:MarR family transcriptional regulator [Deltaproteobacteria bacterium]